MKTKSWFLSHTRTHRLPKKRTNAFAAVCVGRRSHDAHFIPKRKFFSRPFVLSPYGKKIRPRVSSCVAFFFQTLHRRRPRDGAKPSRPPHSTNAFHWEKETSVHWTHKTTNKSQSFNTRGKRVSFCFPSVLHAKKGGPSRGARAPLALGCGRVARGAQGRLDPM